MFGCEKLPLLATNLGKGGMPARVGYLQSWLVDVRLCGSILKHLTIVTYQHFIVFLGATLGFKYCKIDWWLSGINFDDEYIQKIISLCIKLHCKLYSLCFETHYKLCL